MLAAILEAKEITPIGNEITVFISQDNQLNKLRPLEILTSLQKLEADEKILKIVEFSSWWGNRFTGNTPTFVIKTHENFHCWYIEYISEKAKLLGTLVSAQKDKEGKAGWAKTYVPWDIKKVIWQLFAKGATRAGIIRYFERHQDEYKDAPLDTKTINKVKKELDNMPDDLKNKLITELPEVKSLIYKR